MYFSLNYEEMLSVVTSRNLKVMISYAITIAQTEWKTLLVFIAYRLATVLKRFIYCNHALNNIIIIAYVNGSIIMQSTFTTLVYFVSNRLVKLIEKGLFVRVELLVKFKIP